MSEAKPKNDQQYRRRFPRRQFRYSVGVLYKGVYKVIQSQEVGEGGMLIDSRDQIEIGDKVVVNFFVPNNDFVTVTGEVVYHLPVGKGEKTTVNQGIKFTNLPFESKRMIRDYIAEKTSAEV